jgi:hypothetical protein
MLQLEKPTTRKHYYIIHNWTTPVLDFMHINEGNVGENIAQWVVKNLCNTNGLENILMLMYNEQSH